MNIKQTCADVCQTGILGQANQLDHLLLRDRKQTTVTSARGSNSADPGLLCYLVRYLVQVLVQVWAGVRLTCCCSSLNLQGCTHKDRRFGDAWHLLSLPDDTYTHLNLGPDEDQCPLQPSSGSEGEQVVHQWHRRRVQPENMINI